MTPDGRYLVVRGRLWRRSDARPAAPERAALVPQLMTARRAVGRARRRGDTATVADTHATVDAPKRALGERGPICWSDGAPDRMARTTPCAA